MGGSKADVYVAVIGPPQKKKYALQIWKSEQDFKHGKACKDDIELLKVLSVAPDPSRSEVFVVTFMNESKVREKKMFVRTDRNRDVWVEMLQRCVTKVHEEKKEKKAYKHK